MEGSGDPASAAVQAGGRIIQGVAGWGAGRYNARIEERNAGMALRDGAAEASVVRDEARAAMGQQLVEQGASGFQVGTGSARDALLESAVNAEMDQLSIRRSARIKAQGFESAAAMARAKAQTDLVSGFTGAASVLAAPRADYGGGMQVGDHAAWGPPGSEGFGAGGSATGYTRTLR